MPPKRKVLSLEERIDVIRRSGKGESALSIANSLHCGKTQIQNIILDKANIIDRWEKGESSERKTVKRQCVYSALDETVWEWFLKLRSRNLSISGKMIQENALLVAIEFGHTTFAASSGWRRR